MNNVVQIAEQDCAVCLQKCHHPTQLPCGHVFCFLCVKGVAIQSKKCAMCRAEIPTDYLEHPVLLEKLLPELTTQDNTNEEYHWYYEGRNGWWKYDERSNIELETAFNAGEVECTLLLAGALYCIDFQNMIQVRRSDPTRRRRVRRDIPTLPAKGIAGIKNIQHRQIEEIKSENEENTNNITNNPNIDEIIEIVDDEQQGTLSNENVTSNQSNELSNLVNRLSVINLREPTDSSPETEDT